MSTYEKLTRKADGLTTAALESKSPEGRSMLSRFARDIVAVRDGLAETEPVGGEE